MSIRMLQRRGTASQWSTTDPILETGEVGIETDTGKFKIGDGTTEWTELDYAAVTPSELTSSVGDYIPLADIDEPGGVPSLDANSNLNVAGSSIIIEGATANNFETTLTVTDPTEDRTITFPNASGTVALTSDITNLIDSAPAALDTLNELAAALNDDSNFASTITNSIALKAPLNSPTFTGTVDFNSATVLGIDALPSQSENAGKYLTTNGTAASWATITTDPTVDIMKAQLFFGGSN